MNENVKIVINEKDLTSPAGRGTNSTDIAFIPGFSSKLTAPMNEPTLCTSVEQFVKLFGDNPLTLTETDVADYKSYGFLAGDPDRSHVYAKELLHQGLSIVYSNLTEYSDFEPAENTTQFYVPDKTYDPKPHAELVYDSGFVITAKNSIEEKTIQLSTKLPVKIAAGATTILRCALQAENCDVLSAKFMEKFDNVPDGFSHTRLDDTHYMFTATAAGEVLVTLHAEVKLTLKADETARVILKSLPASVMNAFYTFDTREKDFNIGTALKTQLDLIGDKSLYSVKYITSGGYPAVVTADKLSYRNILGATMANAAEHRGDAVALIDYQMNESESSDAFYTKMSNACASLSSAAPFAAAMYPWAHYTCTQSGINDLTLPASFGYLECLASAIKTSPNWLAMAGVSRGVVRGINKLCTPNNVLSNSMAEHMQPKFGTDGNTISINCITDVKPYGLTLWGNRTLKPVKEGGTEALNFLNIRNMLSDIKKLLYTTAKSLMFEPNSDTLWLRFKAGVSPLLEQLKAGNGIADYKIIKSTTKYNGSPLTKGELSAVIKIYPLYAVEYFELTVEISDEDVTVS